MYIYIYIYVYVHTHILTCTHVQGASHIAPTDPMHALVTHMANEALNLAGANSQISHPTTKLAM